MFEPQENKVNAFEETGASRERSLEEKVHTLSHLLELSRTTESAEMAEVCSRVPDIVAGGLKGASVKGVRLCLNGGVFLSSNFKASAHVYRRKIRGRQGHGGYIDVHLHTEEALSAVHQEFLGAVAEHIGRFCERTNLRWALEQSEQHYQQLFRQARDGIVLVDAETGIILDANESFLETVGLGLDHLCSRKIWELVAPARRKQFRIEFDQLASGRENYWLSLPIIGPGTSTLELEVSCSVLQFGERQVLQFICRDITERLHLTRRLIESENRYRAIFESAPVAMVMCDPSGVVMDVNTCLLTKFFGGRARKEDLVDKHLFDLGLFEPDLRPKIEKFFEGTPVQLNEVALKTPPSDNYANVRLTPILDEMGRVKQGIVVIEDITAIKKAQEAIIHSAKMAAVGQMTSGIAHEIGTPLGIISANVQYLLQEIGEGKGTEELRVIESETNRITNMIRQLLIFARPTKFNLIPMAINRIVLDVLELMRTQEIMRHIQVETDLSAELPPVPVAPDRIKQVFLNLIINACQAMPDGGRLTIRSRLGDPQPGKDGPPSHVELTFSDTGVGIPPENLPRVFTPFFTTKEIGKGTGLGLSISYRIVQDHGGAIAAESPGEGKGATFRVYLPLAAPTGQEGTEASEGSRETSAHAAEGG